MSFASEVKYEIVKNELGDICCIRAELAGMVGAGAVITPGKLRFKTEKGVVAQRFFQLIKRLYNFEPESAMTDGGLFDVVVTGDNVLKILRDLKMATTPIRIQNEIIRNECCNASVVKGAFLGGGSVSNPIKGYHAEITTPRFALSKDLSEILNKYEIYPKQIVRNGNHVLYIKESEQIENFLALIGAHNNMMEFLNVKIEKDMRNTTNRRSNCEAANLIKAAQAGAEQRNAIIKVKTMVGFDSLSPELLELAVMRLNHSDFSLSEIAARLGVSKSCINHRMRKLLSIAKGLEEN